MLSNYENKSGASMKVTQQVLPGLRKLWAEAEYFDHKTGEWVKVYGPDGRRTCKDKHHCTGGFECHYCGKRKDADDDADDQAIH